MAWATIKQWAASLLLRNEKRPPDRAALLYGVLSMPDRCLQSIRPARSDLPESKRVAELLHIDIEKMLQFETEVAGRVFVDGTGRLLIIDTVSPDAGIDMEAKELRTIMAQAIVQYLPPRQRLVVVERFFEGRTLDEVARELNVSTDEIGRLQARAILRLRQSPELQALMRGWSWR